MPRIVVATGMTLSSSDGTITGTNLDDADAVTIFLPVAFATGSTYIISFSPTDTGTAFFSLYSSVGGSPVIMSCSSGRDALTISRVTFKRLRVTASAVETGTNQAQWIFNKQIEV